MEQLFEKKDLSTSFFFPIYLFFIYFWLHWVFIAVHGAFSSCSEQGLLFVAVHGLLIAVASHCVGFSCCGAQALGVRASVAVACRL